MDKMNIDYVKSARLVFDNEINELINIKDRIGEEFIALVEEVLACKGRLVVTGMGKSGHVARKIAATLSSLGTSAYFLHPAEAVHGDLGVLKNDDIVIALSNSGETEEVVNLIPSIKKIGARLISFVCRRNTTLEKYSDLVIHIEISREACEHNLAPTTSTTAFMVYGDALAIVLSKVMGFSPNDFAIFHPKGTLGKRLLVTVKDLMYKDKQLPKVKLDTDFREVIFEMNSKSLKMVNVVDDNNRLLGIITDGDLRRSLYEYEEMRDIKVANIYQKDPIVINDEKLAVEALRKMITDKFVYSFLPVVDNNGELKGLITFADIAKNGINL